MALAEETSSVGADLQEDLGSSPTALRLFHGESYLAPGPFV